MVMSFAIHDVVSVKAFKTEKNTYKDIRNGEPYFSKNLIITDVNGAVIKIQLYSHGKKGELTIINEEAFR